MLQNNIELDLKTKLIESGTTQTEVAEKVGVTLSYVNRITKGREQIVSKTFVKMMDAPGYDAELTQGRITVSSGCASFDPSMDKSAHRVLERADEKMYQRKKQMKGEGR